MDTTTHAYTIARNRYLALGVDPQEAMDRIDRIPISVHCWQGDDVQGFEEAAPTLSGGIAVTGDYPGKPRNIDEFRSDIAHAFAYIPGAKKFNLHAIYLDAPHKVPRDEIEPQHFSSWVQWAKDSGVGLDFNPTCFSHPLFDHGFSLSHPKKDIRDFWIRHVRQCRKINASFGTQLKKTAIHNLWIPDGYKDTPVDRISPRRRLMESLDKCFAEDLSSEYHLDAVEGKLFGIGSESYVVGSHEFYMGYALTRNLALCLDTGHFHPTEMVSNKISSVALFLDNILLHVSRPVRWDSDHVVVLEEELVMLAQEILRNNLEHKVHIGLDYFDASINRIVAWILGARNMRKALLIAALEPSTFMIESEQKFDFTTRLVYQEEMKTMPWNAIWNYYCEKKGVQNGLSWYEDTLRYENSILSKRQ